MKILFLDFDGVLNSKQHILMVKKKELPGRDSLKDADLEFMRKFVNSNNMWCLKYILDNVPDLKVVISSAWRNHFDLEEFRRLFAENGMDGSRIIGKTDKKLSSERCHEIGWYLDDLPKNQKSGLKWIAVDDHVIWNTDEQRKSHEYLTNSDVGLTIRDAWQIIKYFQPDFKEPIVLL